MNQKVNANGQVTIKNLNKYFNTQAEPLHVLEQINLDIASGEFISIV